MDRTGSPANTGGEDDQTIKNSRIPIGAYLYVSISVRKYSYHPGWSVL